MKRQLYRDRGFSLIELMVVIGFLAILMSLAIPGGSSLLSAHKAKASVIEVFSRLRVARTRAIFENQPYSVLFNAANNTYRVFSDANANGAFDIGVDVDYLPGGTVSLQDVMIGSANISLIGGGVAPVATFLPDGGMLNGLGGTVVFNPVEVGGRSYTINLIGPTGRVSF